MATASSSSTLKDSLIYFKKKLERTTDEETIIQIIHKLSKVPITLDLLQGTGAGKLMRTLSKKSGTVGVKASALLNKWREAAANSQKSDENVKQNKSSKSNLHDDDFSIKIFDTKHNGKEKSTKEKHLKENHTKEKHLYVKVRDKQSNDGLVKSKHVKDNMKDKYIKSKEIKDKHNKEKHSKEKHIKSSPKEKHDPNMLSLKINEKSVKNEYCAKENEKSKYISDFQYDSLVNSDCDYNPEEICVKNGTSNSKNSVNVSVTYEPTPKKSKSFETTESFKNVVSKSTNDNTQNSASVRAAKKNGTSHSHKKSSSLKNCGTFSKEHVKTEKSSSDYKKSESDYKKSASDYKKSKKSKNSDIKSEIKKLSKKVLKIKPIEVFTSSEVSFEDCLSFNDIVSVKKRKSSKFLSSSSIKKNNSSSKSESLQKSTTHKNGVVPHKIYTDDRIVNQPLEIFEKSEKCSKNRDILPKHTRHTQGSKNQEVNLISTLPQTQPNYRPLPHKSYESGPVKKKVLTNEDAIKFTSSRREKTAVYSGRKNCYLTEVPTLFECCTRVLIENIDDIEYMGEIPYFLLESMLKRCTSLQLARIEHFNPNLLEETNELWEVHCKRDYRSARRQENETWRELYWRTHDEQAERLRNVTANISASIANSNPVRKAKLAYIDAVVKPPRDVARRQAKNGTGLPTNHTVTAGPPSKSTARPTAPAINAASTSRARVEIIKPQKPRIAPLMAKTLKSMKQCFRR